MIQGADNRQLYVYSDPGPGLTVGQAYWYRVEWVDLLSAGHLEPPAQVAYGTLARVATAYYQIVHNAVDNDLLIRVGCDLNYDPGSLGGADFEVLGPGENKQDSARVVLDPTIPANTGTSTVGTIEHFWSVGFKQDAGYVNRTGRVTAFSLFVNTSPGSPSGTTYVTTHTPMPTPTGEFGLAPALLWIPEAGATAVEVAAFRAESDPAGCRLTLLLLRDEGGLSASVYRSASDDFETRGLLTPDPISFAGSSFEYLDQTAEPGHAYNYWIELREADGNVIWNGPVSATSAGAPSVTFAASAHPNPVSSRTSFDYAIGSDVAARGPVAVSLTVHDLQGRLVRTLRDEPQGVGQYRVEWDAADGGGRRLGAGVYYLRFRAGPVQQSRKISVVR